MMEPLISIIVPVYKVEEYLGPCVDSILAQSYKNIEVILVDDGSPDRCGELCDGYAKGDSRVVVIHKKNGGLSDARNAGMAVAKGDWLMFVDSDDLLPTNAVDTLLEIAQSAEAELVIGGHRRFSDVPEDAGQCGAWTVMTPEEAMKDMFRNGCAAWARIYRREIHEGILYPVGEINEDEAIVLRILDRCSRIAKTDTVIYHYRCRPESITTTSFHKKKLVWAKHCGDNLAYIRQRHSVLELDAADRYLDSLQWSLSSIALSGMKLPAAIKAMRRELLRERTLFRRVPLPRSQDRFRIALLTYGPFWVYRIFIRLKRM